MASTAILPRLNATETGKRSSLSGGQADRFPPLALYVHWPFCVSKCPYCDFNSHVRDKVDQQEWRDALLALGHDVSVAPPFDSGFGHANVITVDDSGVFAAAADPRARVSSAAGT